MLIVYTPADGGEAEYLDLRSVRVNESSIISRTMDATWTQVKERLRDGDPEAMQVVVWVLKKRAEPGLRLADFNPLVDDLMVRLDKAEIEEWVTAALDRVPDGGLTPEQILQAFHMIVASAADQEHAQELILRLAAAPKDPAPGAETEGLSGLTGESTS